MYIRNLSCISSQVVLVPEWTELTAYDEACHQSVIDLYHFSDLINRVKNELCFKMIFVKSGHIISACYNPVKACCHQ